MFNACFWSISIFQGIALATISELLKVARRSIPRSMLGPSKKILLRLRVEFFKYPWQPEDYEQYLPAKFCWLQQEYIIPNSNAIWFMYFPATLPKNNIAAWKTNCCNNNIKLVRQIQSRTIVSVQQTSNKSPKGIFNSN